MNSKIIINEKDNVGVYLVETDGIPAGHKVALCDIETFEKSRRIKTNRKGIEYKENRGEYFEYLVAQKFNAIQNEKSNLKHTEGGDIEINGIPYQVKFEGAGIATGRKVR